MTTPDYDDLLQRMQESLAAYGLIENGDLREAIDAIASLRAERDEWKAAVFAADQHAADLVAERDALIVFIVRLCRGRSDDDAERARKYLAQLESSGSLLRDTALAAKDKP